MPNPEEWAAENIPPRKNIEGEILLCRGSTFKSRYVQIKDRMFLYKREKDDSEPRHIIDLQKAKISQGKRSTGEAIFNIYTSELEIKI